ncbi:MAG TPA: FAD-binding oxidoreductase [Candidatus Paceibacterota bacterium]|jgi:FAD/FMN-containing dehydrogenase|nr:FAD-binding oxidoreductase [Candidatus Paceibacterota bacterium]
MFDPKKLSKIIEGDVSTSAYSLDKASHDASLFEVRPTVVVSPKNVADVEKLVRYVADEALHRSNSPTQEPKLTLTARSAGTDMSGGPLTESIVVDFTKSFNHIKEVKEKALDPIAGVEITGFAVTEPGVYYRDFDKATLATGGQIMPSYPASRELCTVGGMVANNSGGEKTLTYGKTERYVRRLNMVTADGKQHEFRPLTMHELEQAKKFPSFESDIYRKMHELIDNNYDLLQKAKPVVSKNSSGYFLWNVWDKEKGIFDLTKMIVGSQGTLGLVTEIEFALVKPKKYSHMVVVFLKDLAQLAPTATHIMEFKPESFESYDDHTFKVALKFLPSLIKRMKGNIISLGLQFIPEMLAVIRGGVPKMVLMAEFTADTDEEALRLAVAAHDSLKGIHESSLVTKTARQSNKYWVIRRESFNMLRQHVKGLRTAPFIDDFVVPPETLPKFLPRLYAILGQYEHDITYTIAGHVGDGNFHIIPLMNLNDPKSHTIIEDLSVKVYKLVHEFNGSISGEHNDGIIRTPFVKMQYGEEVYKLFEEVKKIWDPQGIFNPGKKVGGTLEYAFKHLVKNS